MSQVYKILLTINYKIYIRDIYNENQLLKKSCSVPLHSKSL